MPARKGQPKAGGRQKGTPNKKTVALLEMWDELKYDPAHALNVLLPELEPKQQADIHLKLMEYKYPKRKAVEISGPDSGPLDVSSSDTKELVKELVQTLTGYADEKRSK